MDRCAMRSQIVKRSFVIAGQKKSISLEEAVWRSLKEIATNSDHRLPMVEGQGGGDRPISEDQPHAKQIAHAPQPAVWSADKERQPLPVSGDAERPLPNARRDVPGRPERYQ